MASECYTAPMLWFDHGRRIAALQAELQALYTILRERSAQEDAHTVSLQEAVQKLTKATAALETAFHPAPPAPEPQEPEDYAGWPAELLREIDWKRWGHEPPHHES